MREQLFGPLAASRDLASESLKGRLVHVEGGLVALVSHKGTGRGFPPVSGGVIEGSMERGDPVIQEEAVRELLSRFDVHKSMGPDGIHPRAMRELADELAKPLSIIYQ